MREYNGLPKKTVLALAVAALMAGCASKPAQTETYPVEVPPPPPVAEPEKPAPQVRRDAPLRYVVKKGDTLWDIAGKFLNEPWHWPDIWYVNPNIKNPHLIYPNEVLTLTYVNGRPLIRSSSGVSLGGSEQGDGRGADGRLAPSVRSESTSTAIPAIPVDAISDFLQKTRVVAPEALKDAPYVVDFVDPRLTGGAGDVAYVKGLKAGTQTVHNVVRLGQKFRDPETGEDLGWEALPVGDAEVRDFNEVSTVALVGTVREVRPGDQLLPPEEDGFDAYFYPKVSAKGISGRILSILEGTGQIGQYSIVSVNRGAREGVERGDVFTIMQSGRSARDPYGSEDARVALPDVDAGTLMIFKVTPKVSYGLVMTATRAIREMDRIVPPNSPR